MHEKRELTIRQAIALALRPKEELLSLNKSHKSESVYAIIINEQRQYIGFRLSEHGTYSGFLSIPTFQIAPAPKLALAIQNYLAGNSWTNLSYQDFYVLKIITFGKQHQVTFQIDDLFAVFSEQKQGMIFYQVRQYHHNKRIDANGLNELTNQTFRKLFSIGVIASYTQPDNTLSVYVTEAGRRLIDKFSNQYITQFAKDFSEIDGGNIKAPALEIK